jgi:hypothetical protein
VGGGPWVGRKRSKNDCRVFCGDTFAQFCKKKTGVEGMIRHLFVAASLVAISCVAATPAMAQFGQGNLANNLFSNYATQAGPSTTTAGMYPAPHYSPSLGAQSYYTYQPLMPHEMMYQHSRNYYNYYNTGGYMGAGAGCGTSNALNKTSVRWQSGTNHMGPLPFSTGLGDLNYRIQNRKYKINGGGGRVRGTRLQGGLGCTDGNCGGSGFSAAGGCASGGCTANLSDDTLNR